MGWAGARLCPWDVEDGSPGQPGGWEDPDSLDPSVPESHHAQASSFTVCWGHKPEVGPSGLRRSWGVATGAAQLCLQNQSRGCHYGGQSGEGSRARRRRSPKADALSSFSLSWLFLSPLSPPPHPHIPSYHYLVTPQTPGLKCRPASSAIPSHTGPRSKDPDAPALPRNLLWLPTAPHKTQMPFTIRPCLLSSPSSHPPHSSQAASAFTLPLRAALMLISSAPSSNLLIFSSTGSSLPVKKANYYTF